MVVEASPENDSTLQLNEVLIGPRIEPVACFEAVWAIFCQFLTLPAFHGRPRISLPSLMWPLHYVLGLNSHDAGGDRTSRDFRVIAVRRSKLCSASLSLGGSLVLQQPQ